jgi:hypothetical protein
MSNFFYFTAEGPALVLRFVRGPWHCAILLVLFSCTVSSTDPKVVCPPCPQEETPPVEKCFSDGYFEESAHMTNSAPAVPVLGAISGRVHSMGGPWPEGIEIVVEITTLEGLPVARLEPDETGYFWMEKSPPDGYYCYQATAPGWSAEIGLLKLDRSSSRRYFTVTLPLGV